MSPSGQDKPAAYLAATIIEFAKRDWDTRCRYTVTYQQRGLLGTRELYTAARREGWASPRDELIGFFRGPWCRFLWESITDVPIEIMWKELGIDKVKECQVQVRGQGRDTKRCVQFVPRIEGKD